MDIQEYLREHPLPWRIKNSRSSVHAYIFDANDNRIDWVLDRQFGELVVERVNSINTANNAVVTDSIERKDAMLNEATAKIEELRKERDTAIAQRDAALAESDGNRTRLLDARVLAASHGRALNSANVEIEQLKARLAEVIAERETAIDDAAELHALFGTQQELIERLQARIKRMEAKR